MSATLMDTDPVIPRGDPTLSQAPPHNAADPAASPVPPLSLRTSVSPKRESTLSPLAAVFIGADGLYPGTRWLIYVLLSFVTLGILNSLLHGFQPERVPVWWTMVGETRLMLAAVLPGFVMARLEGRPFGDFGLPFRSAFGRNFWIGAVWGIVALSVLMVVMRVIGVFSFGSLNLHGARIFKFAFYYAVFFVITGIFEEFLVRGYSQWVLTQGMHFWPAAALLSIVFGAMHLANHGESKVGIAAVMFIGFFFCLTLRRTGNLWWAVGFHMTWDWGESFFYSVPDSGNMAPGHLLRSSFQGPDWLTGGSVGPEGSALLFVLMVALWFAFSRAYPEIKYRFVRGSSGDTLGAAPEVVCR